MSSKEQLHHLVVQLPESEFTAAARYLEFLLSREAPVDSPTAARTPPLQSIYKCQNRSKQDRAVALRFCP